MGRIPDYVGVCAFGIKMGVVVPGTDIVKMVCEALAKCDADGLLDDRDTACITESVVARAQNNYITVHDIAFDVRKNLMLNQMAKSGLYFRY